MGLQKSERMMVRRTCGVHLKSRTDSAELNKRFGIECITDVVRRSDCGGMVICRKERDDLVLACRSFKFKGVRDRGKGRKT